MAKIRIYLDVDGVLNAVPPAKDIVARSQWPNFESVKVNGYTITYAPELLRKLENLAGLWAYEEDDDEMVQCVEIVWLTTWRELAVSALAPGIGFDATHWRVVSDGNGAHGYQRLGFSDYSYWWKVDALASDLIANPVDYVVWLDDDQISYRPSVTSLIRKFADTQFLPIAPATEIGLTVDHIDLVSEFIYRASDDNGQSRFDV